MINGISSNRCLFVNKYLCWIAELSLQAALEGADPDFIDKLVGLTFGNMAYDAILEGKTGLMSALVEGRYDLVPIPDVNLGPRKLDVASTYNTERYRPIYGNKQGLPIFLNRAS
jgi:hypothetical protein